MISFFFVTITLMTIYFILVLNRINQVPFIAITVDSTSDIANQEMYSIIIRYCLNFRVEERLFSFDELNTKIGQEIVDYILTTFKKYGVSTTKIIGQSYDGASNMTGKNIGVQTLLSEKLNRKVIFIPCGAHRSDLGRTNLYKNNYHYHF